MRFTFPLLNTCTRSPVVHGLVVPRPVAEPDPTIEIGDGPITVKDEQVTEPEHDADVVAIFPRVAGVPFVEVQYGKNPAVSWADVATFPVPPEEDGHVVRHISEVRQRVPADSTVVEA